MKTKRELTEILIRELPEQNRLTANQAYSEWWLNQRESGGFRLTEKGFTAFKKFLDLEHHRINIAPKELTTKLIMLLDKRLTSPYYLEVTRKPLNVAVLLFGSREATMALLHDTLKDFVDGLRNR